MPHALSWILVHLYRYRSRDVWQNLHHVLKTKAHFSSQSIFELLLLLQYIVEFEILSLQFFGMCTALWRLFTFTWGWISTPTLGECWKFFPHEWSKMPFIVVVISRQHVWMVLYKLVLSSQVDFNQLGLYTSISCITSLTFAMVCIKLVKYLRSTESFFMFWSGALFYRKRLTFV